MLTRGALLLTIAAIALAGCGGDPAKQTQAKVLSAWIDAINAQDWERVCELTTSRVASDAADFSDEQLDGACQSTLSRQLIKYSGRGVKIGERFHESAVNLVSRKGKPLAPLSLTDYEGEWTVDWGITVPMGRYQGF